MPTLLNPYLGFRDTTRPAMEFYRSIFGGELTLSTFADFQASDDAAEQEKIMHARLAADNGLVLMGSDTPNSMELPEASPHSLSLSGEDADELRRYWEGLSDGGTVITPLERAPWGDLFGMCVDRFGVNWMVNISDAGQQ